MTTEEYKVKYSHGNASASALPEPPEEIRGNAKTVFISYSTKNPEAAAFVCEWLEFNGMRCWVAPRDLLPGTNFADNIEIALGNAKMLVLVLSKQSVASPWVEGEINTAFSAGKPILVFQIDNVEPVGSLRVMLSNSLIIYKSKSATMDGMALASCANRLLSGEKIIGSQTYRKKKKWSFFKKTKKAPNTAKTQKCIIFSAQRDLPLAQALKTETIELGTMSEVINISKLPWIREDEVSAGFQKRIDEALLVIPILSQEFEKLRAGMALIKFAFLRRKTILLYKIHPYEPARGLNLMVGMMHWLDVSKLPRQSDGIREFRKVVATHLKKRWILFSDFWGFFKKTLLQISAVFLLAGIMIVFFHLFREDFVKILLKDVPAQGVPAIKNEENSREQTIENLEDAEEKSAKEINSSEIKLESISVDQETMDSEIKSFEIAAQPITQAQWESVMGASEMRSRDDDFSAKKVSWEDAMAFCQKLTAREREAWNILDSLEYTLPSREQINFARSSKKSIRIDENNEWTLENSGTLQNREFRVVLAAVKKSVPAKNLQNVDENSVPAEAEKRVPAGKLLGTKKMGEFEIVFIATPSYEVKKFGIGKTEVTQAQWESVMGKGKNPSHFRGKRLPVEMVSWDEAMEFCEKLTARERKVKRLSTNYKYTLPTRAQWEIACRAGTKTRFCSGNLKEDLTEVAWFHENANGKTHPVGTKKPNAWGLCDMHGNVAEWCLDEIAWSGRDIRGGSWRDVADFCDPAEGNVHKPNESYDYLGFRVALVPEK